MSELELYEQIEDYLKNRLPQEARESFEARMAADPALAKEVDFHRNMMQSPPSKDVLDLLHLVDEIERTRKSDSKDVSDLRNQMNAAYEQYKNEKSGGWAFRLGARQLRWAAAASIALAIVAGIWLMQPKPNNDIAEQPIIPPIDTLVQPPDTTDNKPTTQPGIDYAALAQEAYGKPYETGELMSGSDEPDTSSLQKAGEAYDKAQSEKLAKRPSKSYLQKTIVLLDTLPEEGQVEALKLRAHTLFQLERYAQAATDFKELTNSISYRNEAQWYLLLCYAAQLPKTKSAYKASLNQVSAARHPFQKEAVELKNKIGEQ